jgi:exonuclease III
MVFMLSNSGESRELFDIICLQETKTPDELFPQDEIKKIGYKYMAFKLMMQKTQY